MSAPFVLLRLAFIDGGTSSLLAGGRAPLRPRVSRARA